jgi:hypothetical protein
VRSICLARLAWISCPQTARNSDWATVAVRIGPQPTLATRDLPDQRVAGEAPQELGMVVVER